jgi:hypothetical protein
MPACRFENQTHHIRQRAVILARSLQDHDPGRHQLIVEREDSPSSVHHVCRPARCEKETFFDMQIRWDIPSNWAKRKFDRG